MNLCTYKTIRTLSLFTIQNSPVYKLNKLGLWLNSPNSLNMHPHLLQWTRESYTTQWTSSLSFHLSLTDLVLQQVYFIFRTEFITVISTCLLLVHPLLFSTSVETAESARCTMAPCWLSPLARACVTPISVGTCCPGMNHRAVFVAQTCQSLYGIKIWYQWKGVSHYKSYLYWHVDKEKAKSRETVIYLIKAIIIKFGFALFA